jgi:hypothetical protein
MKVAEFATRIGWWISIVPAHSTPKHEPRAFSSFKEELQFSPDGVKRASDVIDEILERKQRDLNVYDSEIYLQDIKRYIGGLPTLWRSRNGGLCDSPVSYFAVLPNGSFAPCCDWRLSETHLVNKDQFVQKYINQTLHRKSLSIVSNCSGCMYGSYPEITTALRFGSVAFERLRIFLDQRKYEIQKTSETELMDLAREINS